MKRSFDFDVLKTLSPGFISEEEVPKWLLNTYNIMLTEEDNIGLATYEYPGLYTVHWFFTSARGRNAINLAKRMCKEMFTTYGARALRGFTPVNNKAARWASRQVGFASYGLLPNKNGDLNEMFAITKEDFENKESETSNGW